MWYAGASWGPGRCRTASNCCGRSRSSRRSRPPTSSASREVAVPRRFAAQQVIFREGDDSDTCYVVRSGHARAVREHADGRTITLAHFGPGDIFGELAMFDDERRSATVETLDELEAVAILGAGHAPPAARAPRDRGEARHRARAAAARGQRAPRAPVLPDRPEPRRGRARPSSSSRPRAEGAGERDVLVTHHAGRHRAARGLLARVGQPLPGRARARRRRHAGPRPADRPRPRRAGALRLLSAAAEREFSAGGVVVRDGEVRGDRADAPGGRRPAGAGAAQGPPRPGRDAGRGRAARGPRGGRRRGRAASRSSATCATGTCATAGGSPRSSLLPARLRLRRSVDDHDHEVEEARWMALEEAARRLTYKGEREMVARALSRTGAR